MQPAETEISPGSTDAAADSIKREDGIPDKAINLEAALKRLRNDIDNLNLDLAVEKTRNWVRDHPVLAVGAAVGIGLATAAIVSSLMEEEEKTKSQIIGEIVRSRVSSASDAVRDQAHSMNEAFGQHASNLSERLVDTVGPALSGNGVKKAVDVVEESVGSAIAQTVKAAAAAAVVQKLSDWFKKYSK